MTAVLEMRGVTKHYGRVTAIHDVSLEIRPGEVVGLIGHNGAGKTTTLRIALDLITDYEGAVRLFDRTYRTDPIEIKKRLGFVPEVVDPTGTLKIAEYVRYAGALHNLRADDMNAAWQILSGKLEFDADPSTRIDTLSKGNRQKLAIATSLLHNPSLWVLDEPLSGLDPSGMKLLEKLVADRRDAGCAVWISTHTLDLIERTCDRAYVMVKSKVVRESNQISEVGSAMQLYEAAMDQEKRPA